MFGNMMGKLQEMQQKMEESKARLAGVKIHTESGNGKIKIRINGNKTIESILIDPSLLTPENTEELEDLMIIATNNAISEAEKAWESEMRNSAMTMLPGGLF
jgi:DNA-binding YbaB/EbfC family protein